MENGGWLKLYWKIKDSVVFSSGTSFALWGYILLNVSRKKRILRNGTILEAGQCVISMTDAAKWLEVHKTTAARHLAVMEAEGMLEVIKRDRNGTTLSVCNWGTYQDIPSEGATKRNCNGTATELEQNCNSPQTEILKKVKKEKKGKNKSPKISDDDRETALWMFGTLRAENPKHKEPNIDEWANVVRLIRERDGYTDEQTRWLWSWARADGFWAANILSPAKLRKQWDQLLARAKSENEKQTDPNGNIALLKTLLEEDDDERQEENSFDRGGGTIREAANGHTGQTLLEGMR